MMSSTGVATRVHPSALARESSPRETASETLAAEGTRWKSGDHWRSAAKPQKEASMPLTEGSFPYPFMRANCPATLSMKAIQKGLKRLAKVTRGRTWATISRT